MNMRFWLAFLLLFSTAVDPPAAVGQPRAPDSISAIDSQFGQPFLPGLGIPSVLPPLQIRVEEGTDRSGPLEPSPSATATAPLDVRVAGSPRSNRPEVPRICERLPYDATAPPALG